MGKILVNPLLRLNILRYFCIIVPGPYERCIPEGYFRDDIQLESPKRFARHIIFATDQQLHLLRRAKRWYGDGTFYICPFPFYQVFCIHAFIRVGDQDKQV